nr:ImmA/IrrE family metallo-endopeptidase [uncultured Schaedlerella sp.]
MNVVGINKYIRKREKKMYENLINKLKTTTMLFSIQDAEELADDVLKDGGFYSLKGPTPIKAIANGFEISTYKEVNMPSEISGNIYVGGNTKKIYGNNNVIIVGADEEYFHQRFIIAHELAHFLIDYLNKPEYRENPQRLFSMTYPKEGHDLIKESRADRFAAELLMPSHKFLNRYIYAMEKSKYNRRYTISYLSSYFEVKKTSIAKRIEEVIL